MVTAFRIHSHPWARSFIWARAMPYTKAAYALSSRLIPGALNRWRAESFIQGAVLGASRYRYMLSSSSPARRTSMFGVDPVGGFTTRRGRELGATREGGGAAGGGAVGGDAVV